jgi:molecular chaperone HscB
VRLRRVHHLLIRGTSSDVSAVHDHFARLGLPRVVRLDRAQLETAYLERSTLWHPDRVATADEATKKRALVESSALNEAYATLRDPVKRAEHLCRLAGIDVELAADAGGGARHEGETSTLRAAPHPGADFLAEMIELRERLDDLEAPADREDLLDEMERECATLRERALAALESARVEEAADMLVRLRYVSRFRDEVAAAVDSP